MADDGADEPRPAAPRTVADFADVVRRQVQSVIVGKPDAVDLLVVALLCRGHVLVEDVPGTGKTMLARAFAGSFGRAFQRVQGTPDLLPSEITGTSVFDQQRGVFEFRPGPVFTNVLLVDEVNRATPRTQSALLEAMAERRVSQDGADHVLPEPFVVLATQNPVEQAGTFPLPEAQLDRFLLRVELGYPAERDELAVLRNTRAGHPIDHVTAVAAGADLVTLWQEVGAVHVDESVLGWLLEIVRATREHPAVALGASVRGSMALQCSAQARAAMAGRDYVLPDDVAALAEPVLSHRLLMTPDSELKGRTQAEVVRQVLDTLDVPVADAHA